MKGLCPELEALPAELLEDARAALLVVGQHLGELDERWSQFGVEARVTWLDAHTCFESLGELRAALLRARDVAELLRGFHETHVGPPQLLAPDAPSLEPAEVNDHDGLLGEAVKAGDAAVRALCYVVDRLARAAGSGKPASVAGCDNPLCKTCPEHQSTAEGT